MKKLIYFYCEDLRGFDDTEFNFSSKYKIHFDKDTKILTIDKGDENYIDDFYGDNIELNAIVGNNGAGKSTLLKNIYHIFYRMRSLFHVTLVFEIMKNDFSELIIIYKGHYKIIKIKQNEKISIKTGFKNFFTQFNGNFFTQPNEISFKFVYISQVLDQEFLEFSNDYSTSGIIRSIQNSCIQDFNIDLFFYENFVNQMNFLSDKVICVSEKNKKIEIPFKINDFMIADILSRGLYDVFEYLFRDEVVNKKDIEQMINNFRGTLHGEQIFNGNLHDRFGEEILSSFLLNIPKEYFGEPFFGFLYSVFDDLKNMEDINEKMNYFFGRVIQNNDDKEKITLFVKPYQELMEYFYTAEWAPGKSKNGYSFIIPFLYKDKNRNTRYGIKEFLGKYSKVAVKEQFLRFGWGLSSGETAMLDLYSKFYQIYKSL